MKFFEILWQRYFMKYIGSYSLEVIAFFDAEVFLYF